MNVKRMAIAFVAVFVFVSLANFVIHGVLLQPHYAQTPQLMRTPADGQAHAPFLMLAFFFFSLAFVWIYVQGVNARPWLGQGIRYGLAVWVLTSVSEYIVYYAIQPWPTHVVCMQIAYELVMNVVAGMLVAVLYRPTNS
jgi:hypothetical protein